MGFREYVKKKLPATLNAVEYGTSRLLARIEELEENLLHTEKDRQKAWNQVISLLEIIQEQEDSHQKMVSAMHQELEALRSQVNQEKLLEQIRYIGQANQERILEQVKSVQTSVQDRTIFLQKKIDEGNLFSIINCKNKKDEEFERKLIPLNQFFRGCGVALSMHLTSVDKKLDESVYRTADLIRTSTLAMVADEIYARNLSGAVAELGVAQGDFARVINALFPDKKLYLFDTFEGFPEIDADYERLNHYSNPQKHWYANINMEQLMAQMRHPDNCMIKKGYFPDTAEGLEESFCFVSIDCDLYKPIYAGLSYFYPRVVKGGYIFVHDYRSKFYGGTAVALRKFAEEQGFSYCVLPDNTGSAVIVK